MTNKNYLKFLNKIDKLNKIVELINDSPEKYQLIIRFETRDDVVKLANLWGFDIGKRLGED